MSSASLAVLCKQYANLIGDDDCDLELQVGPELHSVKVHRIILKTRCAYFNAMFRAGMEECNAAVIKIPLFSARAWDLLLPFIYSGSCKEGDLAMEDLRAIAELADFLQMNDFFVYLHRTQRVKHLLKRLLRGECSTCLEWLSSSMRTPALRTEVELRLIEIVKREWKTLRMLCIANHFDLADLREQCLKDFSQLFRRAIDVASSDSEQEEEPPTAAARFEKDTDLGSWNADSVLSHAYVASTSQAITAVNRGIATVMADEAFMLDVSAQQQLQTLLEKMSGPLDRVRQLQMREQQSSSSTQKPEAIASMQEAEAFELLD